MKQIYGIKHFVVDVVDNEGIVSEPSIIVSTYRDCLTVNQGDNEVTIQYSSANDLINSTKKAFKEKPQ